MSPPPWGGLVAKATARPRPARARGNSPGRAGCPLLPLPAPPDQAEEPPPTPPPPPPSEMAEPRGRRESFRYRGEEEGGKDEGRAAGKAPPLRGGKEAYCFGRSLASPGRPSRSGELQLPEGLSYARRGRRKGGGGGENYHSQKASGSQGARGMLGAVVSPPASWRG